MMIISLLFEFVCMPLIVLSLIVSYDADVLCFCLRLFSYLSFYFLISLDDANYWFFGRLCANAFDVSFLVTSDDDEYVFCLFLFACL